MAIIRQTHTISVTAPGPQKGDTGFLLAGGELHGIRWHATTPDTGNNAIMDLEHLPRPDDSGDGFLFWTKTIGNTDFHDFPVQPVSYGTGADNSGDSGARPIVFAPQDRFRVKIRTTSNIAGRLYVWYKTDRI